MVSRQTANVTPVSSPELKRLGVVAEHLIERVTTVTQWLDGQEGASESRAKLVARLATLADVVGQPARGRAIPIQEVLELRTDPAVPAADVDLSEISAAIRATPRLVNISDQTARGLDVLRVELAHWCAASTVLAPARNDLTIPRPALAESVRLVAEVLAARFPGRAVELRVPPFAAVQLGVVGADESRVSQGPAHTRGTPPNVVEMPPLTLLRLAAGAVSWSSAIATPGVSASGAHADLSHAWPVLR